MFWKTCTCWLPVLQINNSSLWDHIETIQHLSNNNNAFKYRDHRGRLPARFSHSAVISQSWDNSVCSVLSCVWCGGGSVQPVPSDVLRQQDVIENPVREITAQKENGCDWCTNYRKYLMRLSSCMFDHWGEVGLCCFPDSIIPKLRHLVIDKIHHPTSFVFHLSSADKSNVVHWWPHFFVFQNNSNTTSKILSVSIQTWVLSAEKTHNNSHNKMQSITLGRREVCHCLCWSRWKGRESTQVT